MENILYDAAVEYKKLRHVRYEIHLVKRKKVYVLKIHFPEDAFFHLAGLQHLKDITFPSTSKQRIYKDILLQKITTDTISASSFYIEEDIDARIINLYLIESILDGKSNPRIVNLLEYARFTDIKAEYLFEHVSDETFYLFIKKASRPSFKNECVGYSFFRKQERDYTVGTLYAKVLMIKKITNYSKDNEHSEVLYIKDGYAPK